MIDVISRIKIARPVPDVFDFFADQTDSPQAVADAVKDIASR